MSFKFMALHFHIYFLLVTFESINYPLLEKLSYFFALVVMAFFFINLSDLIHFSFFNLDYKIISKIIYLN